MAAVALKLIFGRKGKSGATPEDATRPTLPSRDDIKAFRKALQAGDLAKTQKLLAATPALGQAALNDDTGQTALHIVAETGHLELIELLIKAKADVNLEDADGNAPLLLAMNSMPAFCLLVRAKTIALDRKFSSQPLLHHVCRRFTSVDEDILRRILKKNVNINDVNSLGDTALHVACTVGHSKMAELLLLNGALPNIQNKKGETALFLVAQLDNLRLAKIIVNYGGSTSLFIQTNTGASVKEVASSDEMKEFLISVKRQHRSGKSKMGKKMHSSAAIVARVKKDKPTSPRIASRDHVIQSNSTPQMARKQRARVDYSDGTFSDTENGYSTGPEALERPQASTAMAAPTSHRSGKTTPESSNSPALGDPFLSSSMPSQSFMGKLFHRRATTATAFQANGLDKSAEIARERSFSFNQAFTRLAIMDEGLSPDNKQSLDPYTIAQLRDKLEIELLAEIKHIDPDLLIDIVDKVCSSKSFKWVEDHETNKIETLKYIPEFLDDGAERQAILQYLYDKYSGKIEFDVQHGQSPVKSPVREDVEKLRVKFRLTDGCPQQQKRKRLLSRSKIELRDRKIKTYEWEIGMSELVFATVIGNGSYGIVYRGQWDDRTVALKKFSEAAAGENEIAPVAKEVAILSKLKHPHIIEFLGASIGDEICLVMEYAENGDLRSFLQRFKVDWRTKLRFAREIAEGMHFLHSQQPSIAHRDVKCQNILLTKDGVVKISDFGLSKTIGNKIPSKLGTLNWLAPEMIRGDDDSFYSTKADVYSYGMCLYEILADGQPPFKDLSHLQLVRAIEEGKRPTLPQSTDPEFAHTLAMCWHEEPDQRPSFQQIAEMLAEQEKAFSSLAAAASPRLR